MATVEVPQEFVVDSVEKLEEYRARAKTQVLFAPTELQAGVCRRFEGCTALSGINRFWVPLDVTELVVNVGGQGIAHYTYDHTRAMRAKTMNINGSQCVEWAPIVPFLPVDALIYHEVALEAKTDCTVWCEGFHYNTRNGLPEVKWGKELHLVVNDPVRKDLRPENMLVVMCGMGGLRYSD